MDHLGIQNSANGKLVVVILEEAGELKKRLAVTVKIEAKLITEDGWLGRIPYLFDIGFEFTEPMVFNTFS